MRDVILWILADELRVDALSCYGTPHPRIVTPHIDALAARGIRFAEAYTASPVCVPARVAMSTGHAPDRSGVWGNEAYRSSAGLPRELETFTGVLARAGWATRSFGKEHVPAALNDWTEHDPAGSDMQELRVGAEEASLVRTPGVGTVVAGTWPEGRPFPSHSITTSAIEAIRDARGPLLVRASYLQPHTPVVVPEPWASRYADLDLDHRRIDPVDSRFERRFAEIGRGSRMADDDLRRARATYHGAVAWLDDQVGELLRALEETPDLGRVTVLLTADHGAHLGEDGAFGKHTFAPASHRIPLIVAGDAVERPGGMSSALATNADVARTLLAAAGVPAPVSIGGRDLLGDDEPTDVVSGIGYGATASRAFPNHALGTGPGDTGWPQRVCVRTRRYRLDLTTRVDGRAATAEERDVFLADRDSDPGERVNVFGRPGYERVARLLVDRALGCASHAIQPEDAALFGDSVALAARSREPHDG